MLKHILYENSVRKVMKISNQPNEYYYSILGYDMVSAQQGEKIIGSLIRASQKAAALWTKVVPKVAIKFRILKFWFYTRHSTKV